MSQPTSVGSYKILVWATPQKLLRNLVFQTTWVAKFGMQPQFDPNYKYCIETSLGHLAEKLGGPLICLGSGIFIFLLLRAS
jgi:hypothetical protein